MKILFIGGTKFVGRNMVEVALAKGHAVEILQRGKTHSEIFPEAKRYFGDRVDLAKILPDSQWDVVIDTCGYHPIDVESSAKFLKGRCKTYLFISTVSVYADPSKSGINESSELSALTVDMPPRGAPLSRETYGPLKVLCEKHLESVFSPEELLILRPGIIVGPYDDTNRFDYWIKAALTQDSVVAPHDPKAPVQFIDVRSLSQFAILAAEKSLTGIYNTVGPFEPLSFEEWLKLIQKQLNPELRYEWQSPEDVMSSKKPAPMYVPPDYYGLFQVNGHKAYQAGMPKFSAIETIHCVAEFVKPDLGQVKS